MRELSDFAAARNEPYQCMVQTALNWTMAYATEQGRGLMVNEAFVNVAS